MYGFGHKRPMIAGINREVWVIAVIQFRAIVAKSVYWRRQKLAFNRIRISLESSIDYAYFLPTPL